MTGGTHDDELRHEAADFERAQEQRARRRAEPDDTTQAGTAKDPWENDTRRYQLGIENIDRSARLRRPADFMVVAGLPGGGKTSLLEHTGIANAEDGKRVVIASLEMTKPEIEGKMVGRMMGVDLENFERHRRANTTAYQDALAKLQALPLRLYRQPEDRSVEVQTLFGVAQRAKADMLLIDYTSMIGGWVPGNDARKIVQRIAAWTKATGIFVMLLAQLKTALVLQKNRRPTMDDIEDTKALNQASTSLVLVHRPFLGQPKKDVVAEIVVAKNRKGGPTFTGHVHWYGPTQSFFAMNEAEEAQAECCHKKPAPSTNGKSKRALRDTPTLAPQTTTDDADSWPTEADHDLHPATLFDD